MSLQPLRDDQQLVRRLAEFAAACKFEDLPEAVVEDVKMRILDTLGVALAAWPLHPGQAVMDLVAQTGGVGEAVPIGQSSAYPAEQAAFVSGTLAHALDFDDTHLPSILHPSAIIISTAITVGQATGASGRDIITAAVVGYEVVIRTGMAAYDPSLRNSVFFEKGLHGASICGALGAAAAAAKLLGGTAAQIGHAIGIVSSMAAGLLEANRTGGTVKQIHGGWACHSGVWAAKLAKAGFTGPPTVLEGRFGFYHALCDGRFDPAPLTDDLGSKWSSLEIFFKPYPANHFTHAGIDAALSIRDELGEVDPNAILSIELGVATPTLRTIAQPREAKINPESGYHARFSGPFTVAAALLGGGGLGVYLNDFTDELAADPIRRQLAAKVTCVADPQCDDVFPHSFPAVLLVRMADGRVLERRIMENRGSPARPLSPREVEQKFRLNAERVLSSSQIDGVAAVCNRLEAEQNLAELVSLWSIDGKKIHSAK